MKSLNYLHWDAVCVVVLNESIKHSCPSYQSVTMRQMCLEKKLLFPLKPETVEETNVVTHIWYTIEHDLPS